MCVCGEGAGGWGGVRRRACVRVCECVCARARPKSSLLNGMFYALLCLLLGNGLPDGYSKIALYCILLCDLIRPPATEESWCKNVRLLLP